MPRCRERSAALAFRTAVYDIIKGGSYAQLAG